MAIKTNAMRLLDSKKIPYTIRTYDTGDGKIDGLSVAAKVGQDPSVVYKTLVAGGSSKAVYVFIIPVAAELDLKKAARAAGEKKVEMLAVKDILAYTGYVRGGCSPLGMKKKYPTFLALEASGIEKIIVSGGKIGVQIELAPGDLLQAAEAQTADIVKS